MNPSPSPEPSGPGESTGGDKPPEEGGTEAVHPASERLQDIFHAAIERPIDERTSFLNEACADEWDLHERVKQLIAAYDRSEEVFEAPISPDIERELARLKPEEEGERIGRYKLLQEIGQGGFGTVWMAEQLEPVSRRVALKIIKMGMDTKEVIGRFEQERQALAMMDHPNIAKVFDAGSTPFGRPYFVMELVKGIPITEFCDERQLDMRARLELFAEVCGAINHAHQKGLIHRDIKPTNVLVTLNGEKPVAKVIDFGIAKATQGKLTDKTLFTRFEQFIGTPVYMSPEQAGLSALDIDTRSDIYSLGILLYELLTGKPPFDAKTLNSAGYEEMRRIIREVEPPKPSARLRTAIGNERTTLAKARQVEPDRLHRMVEPDLDWIVMKAIEKDRTRRYETANGLALDIEHFLANEPVTARPPSATYRLRKTIRRNKLAFAAATAVVASLLVGLTLAGLGLREARRERDVALSARAGEAAQKRTAQEAQRMTRQRAYAAEINGAFEALNINNLGRARELLDRQRPAAGEEDLRGFEWRYLWQLCQSDEIASFKKEGNDPGGLAFSPDGRLLAQGGLKIIVLDIASRAVVMELDHPARTIAFSPLTKVMAGGGVTDVTLWNTDTWEPERTLPAARHPVVFSPDGRWLVTGAEGGFRVWNAETWEPAGFCPGVPTSQTWDSLLHAVAFSPDGSLLFTPGHRRGEKGGQFQVWNFPALTPVDSLVHSRPTLWSSAFLPDGKRFVTGQYSGALCVWDLGQGKIVEMIREHTGGIAGIAVSRDGNFFVTASADHSLIIWDSLDLRPLKRLRGHLALVGTLALSPDGSLLASGSADGTINLWHTSSRAESTYLSNSRNIVGFSDNSKILLALPDDRIGLSGSERNSVLRWQIPTNKQRNSNKAKSTSKTLIPDLENLKWESWMARPFALHPDGDRFALGRPNGVIEIWDALHRVREADWLSPDSSISATAFSPDGQIMATGAINGTVRLWDVDSRREVAHYRPNEKTIHHLAFSRDGRWLGCAATSGIRVWDLKKSGPPIEIDRPGEDVRWVAFSPDSRLLVSCSEDDAGPVLWDLPSGRMRARFRGHSQMVDAAAFSPDGLTLATCSRDTRVKLWSVESQQELATMKFEGSCRSIAFSPDGRTLAVGYYHVTDGYRNDDGAHIQLLQAPSWEEIANVELENKPKAKQSNQR